MRPSNLTRRVMLGSLVAALAPIAAHAEVYPSRQLSIVVPSAAGGVLDIVARFLAERMGKDLGQQIIVLNQPGGNSHIGASAVARSAPDGYTLLCAAGSTLISGVTKNLNYDPMNDLVPVARVISSPIFVVVPASSSFRTVADLVAYGRANPGKLLFASSGVGNSTHIGAEMLSSMTGLGAVHVPYRGSVGALTDLAGGRIHFMLDTRFSASSMIDAGNVRVLAVSSPHRLKDLPDLPTVGETVPGFEIEGWVGMFVPKGTPLAIISRLSHSIRITVEDPIVAEQLRKSSSEITFLSPEATRAFQLEDHARISKVVRDAKIAAD